MKNPQFQPTRLKQLAAFLETVPPKHFNMGLWCSYDGYKTDWKGIGPNPTLAKAKECGTTACALGWAPSVPAFKGLGMKLIDDGGEYATPTYKEYSDIEAAVQFFGIPFSMAMHFFGDDDYPDNREVRPKDVAKRIYEYLKDPYDYIVKHEFSTTFDTSTYYNVRDAAV